MFAQVAAMEDAESDVAAVAQDRVWALAWPIRANHGAVSSVTACAVATPMPPDVQNTVRPRVRKDARARARARRISVAVHAEPTATWGVLAGAVQCARPSAKLTADSVAPPIVRTIVTAVVSARAIIRV